MIFRRKKKKVVRRRSGDMIDIAKLHRKGRVLGPERSSPNLKTDDDGFAIVGSNSVHEPMSSPTPSDVSFVDMTSSSSSTPSTSFSTEAEGYSKREVDSKIQELDRLIYKLEQRVEVLERKAGVDPGVTSSSNSASDGFNSLF